MLLQEFDCEVKDRKGSENPIADHLYRLVTNRVEQKNRVPGSGPEPGWIGLGLVLKSMNRFQLGPELGLENLEP